MAGGLGFKQSTVKVQTTVVDFNEIGGAVGSYGTGIFFPVQSSTFGSVFNVLRNFAGGVGALVSVGWRPIDTAIAPNPTEFAGHVAIAGLVTGPSLVAVQTFTATGALQTSWELTFDIEVAPLTDFLMVISLNYIDFLR